MEGQVADVARVHRASLRKVKSVESVGRRKNAPSGGRRAATRRFGIKTWQISASMAGTLGVGNVLCVKHSMDKMMDIGTFCLQFRHEQNVAQNLKDG